MCMWCVLVKSIPISSLPVSPLPRPRLPPNLMCLFALSHWVSLVLPDVHGSRAICWSVRDPSGATSLNNMDPPSPAAINCLLRVPQLRADFTIPPVHVGFWMVDLGQADTFLMILACFETNYSLVGGRFSGAFSLSEEYYFVLNGLNICSTLSIKNEHQLCQVDAAGVIFCCLF